MDAPRITKDRARTLRRRLSLPEVLLWKAIKGRKLRGLHFRKQHPVGPYVLDFYCEDLRLAVEVDGASHGFGDRPQRDQKRDAWLEAQGIDTHRLSASLILKDADDATQTILAISKLGRAPASGGTISGLQPPPSRRCAPIHLPLNRASPWGRIWKTDLSHVAHGSKADVTGYRQRPQRRNSPPPYIRSGTAMPRRSKARSS